MTVTTPSITQNGRLEPFELQVGRGQITGHSVIHVFGHNPDVDQTEVTVWPAAGILTHPASPIQMKISSTSANDTGAGTGARTVYILGINGTGGYVSETVELTGRTAVTTEHSYDAIEQMTVMSVGSGGVNAGTIYAGTGTVTAGVPATIYSAMGPGDNLSLVGHWTCPTGYTGYLVRGLLTCGTTGTGQYITGRLKQRGQDGIVRTAAVTTVSNGVADYDFAYPVKILEGECVTATAKGSNNNNDVASYFQIVLIKNDGSL